MKKHIGKYKITFLFRIEKKRKYIHSQEWIMKTIMKDSIRFGTGVIRVQWVKPWEFWKK